MSLVDGAEWGCKAVLSVHKTRDVEIHILFSLSVEKSLETVFFGKDRPVCLFTL